MGQVAWSAGWGPGNGTSPDTWGHRVIKLRSLENSHFAKVLRRQMCGIHIFRTFESFIQAVPLLPVSDVVPQGPSSDVVERVVVGMGCLFQVFLSLGSVGRQDG